MVRGTAPADAWSMQINRPENDVVLGSTLAAHRAATDSE
jgi:hypothetical protein